MSNQDEILADFKSCTGIEDNNLAIAHLDAADWDLLHAITKVLPGDTQKLPSESHTQNETPEPTTAAVPKKAFNHADKLENNVVSVSDDFLQGSSNSSPSKKICFSIHCDKNGGLFDIWLCDEDTVFTLKSLLRSYCGVPPCRQLLVGWPGSKSPENDRIVLSTLNLPANVRLNLLTEQPTGSSSDTTVDTTMYTLKIVEETTAKEYILRYPGSKLILDIKNDIYSVTNVPLSQQIWSGWPANVSDYTPLNRTGINLEHNLSVKSAPISAKPAIRKSKRLKSRDKRHELNDSQDADAAADDDDDNDDDDGEDDNVDVNNDNEDGNDEDDDDDDEDDDYEDDDFDMSSVGPDDTGLSDDISNEPAPSNLRTLIPGKFDDEMSASVTFINTFEERYGPLRPDFFLGSLEEAFREACFKPAKDRKLLAVYLHHDKSVLTNVFCAQLLCYDSVIQFLSSHFIVWGWDLTLETNKAHLLNNFSTTLGPLAESTVNSVRIEKMPLVILINRVRGSTEILTVIYGSTSINEFMSTLIQSVDIFTEQRSVESVEEDVRAKRELIKEEQDEAYQHSLAVDRAKEEAKLKQERMEREELAKEEQEKMERAASKEATRQMMETTLPPEPAESTNTQITKIRIRDPQSSIIERRFLVTQSLQVLFNFLTVKGYYQDEYKLVTSFPRRDLTTVDPAKTFEDLKLYPQETLVIERV